MEEEELGNRERFMHNSIGQPVYVGDSSARKARRVSGGSALERLGSGSERDREKEKERERDMMGGSYSRSLSGIDAGIVVESGDSNSNSSEYMDELACDQDCMDLDAVEDGVLGGDPLDNARGHNLGDVDEEEEEEDEKGFIHPQDRGNPFLGWIPWTLNLSYDRMLRGIPGTGTRYGGMGGKLLGVNLDAIVLFRYHALCLRVTAVACFICIGVILPLNLTACNVEDIYCQSIPANANLTNYGRTTIANIMYTAESSDYSDSSGTTTGGILTLDKRKFQFFSKVFWADHSLPHLIRLYLIALCTWLITYYTLKNIQREWRENLVLRRVYYLEADHYGNRQAELDKTVYLPHDDDTDEESDDEDDEMDLRRRRAVNKGIPSNKQPKYKKRNPWIPHPEHRDTIPNIELYSVLVGGLPSLPSEVVNTADMEAAIGFSKRASIDWQLAVATTFFDHCVPNQPGFSSSVVAVTILPGAPELAKAWRKWYAAAAALRRLRFIRQVIADKKYYDIDDVEAEDEDSFKDSDSRLRGSISQHSFYAKQTPSRSMTSQSRHSDIDEDSDQCAKVTFLDDETAASRLQDAEIRRQVGQYRQNFGVPESTSEVDIRIFKSLNYGPEQQAVYSREMAQGAAACCPNGCCEGRVRRSPIDKLLAMEEATIERLENAQYELQCAQMQAAVSILDTDRKSMRKDSAHDTEILLQQSSAADMDHLPNIGSSVTTNVEGISAMTPHNKEAGLPTLDHVYSKSVDGEGTIDVSPKTLDFLSDGVSDQSDGLQKTPCRVSFIPGSGNKKLEMESQLLAKYGPALPSYAQSEEKKNDSFEQEASPSSKTSNVASPLDKKCHATPQARYSLQTINEDKETQRLSFHNLQISNQSPCNSKSSAAPPSRTILRMNSEGRFLFNPVNVDEDDESSTASARNSRGVTSAIRENPSMTTSGEPSLRRRAYTGQSHVSNGDVTTSSNQWDQVNSILRIEEQEGEKENNGQNVRTLDTGVWEMPSFKSTMASVKSSFISSLMTIGRWTKVKADPITSKLAKDSTYAVVTFSSRQAAVAARHCLADGRGVQRWLSVESVPVPPLADAAPCDIITCRGCCRPVTLNLNRNQMLLRRYFAMASLIFIYIFYTIPITAAKKVVEPSSLQRTLPGLYNWFNQTKYLSADILSGLVSALLYTTFFALCPVMFKMIANAGSQATSVQEAEKYALQYYWYFMLVTAFVFTGLADAAIDIWNHSNVEQSLGELVENIASATPLATSATWLNWIIVRTTMTLPLQYMLQVNTFIFSWIGWRCCARCTMGGGPGGPIPYRIYVDGGVVFVCVVSLAPQSPLVAPAALLYYLFCVPLWRRNCIFLYRPKFDSGGERWPFLSDVLITSLFMGQFLLTLQMVLRDAFGPALIAAFPAIPTYLFRNHIVKRFRRAYDDAGLLQTSLLDGWDNTLPTSMEKREEFRQFLVDAHKAAYIPVCIAGGATNILTAEPAVVIPSENDDMLGYSDVTGDRPDIPSFNGAPMSPYFGDQSTEIKPPNGLWTSDGLTTPTSSNQRGGLLRRTVSYSSNTPRSQASPMNFEEPQAPVATNGADQSRTTMLWKQVRDRVDEGTVNDGDPGCTQS